MVCGLRPLAVNVMYDGVYVYRPWMKDRDLERAATVLSNQLAMPKDQILAGIRKLASSKAVERKILYGNARRLLKL